MGARGSGLYANDTTSDVRDTYMGYLRDQLSDEEAYKKTLDEYSECIGDNDEEPLFWFAMAESQWRVGRLLPEVKSKALEWIEKDGGLDLWLESKTKGAGWKKTLVKLKEKLESPMPKYKKVRKPEVIDNNLWNLNDVYAYQFSSKLSEESGYYGKYMLIQKIGEGVSRSFLSDGVCMSIQILDKMFDTLPSIDDIKKIRVLPMDFPDRVTISEPIHRHGTLYKKEPIWMNALISMSSKREYPRNCLTYIGNGQGPYNLREDEQTLSWWNIDSSLILYYNLWQGIEYDTISEGIYDYNPKK